MVIINHATFRPIYLKSICATFSRRRWELGHSIFEYTVQVTTRKVFKETELVYVRQNRSCNMSSDLLRIRKSAANIESGLATLAILLLRPVVKNNDGGLRPSVMSSESVQIGCSRRLVVYHAMCSQDDRNRSIHSPDLLYKPRKYVTRAIVGVTY